MAAGVKLFFDGGWRPGSGMELAVVHGGRTHVECDLGSGSAMEAEWLALLRAAAIACEVGATDPVLLGDAVAVIAQATGGVRCPAPYRRHLQALHDLEPARRWRIRYVKRTQNLAGIALARSHERR